MKSTPSPPLRRSERNRNVSSSDRKLPIRDSRIYRAILTQPKNKGQFFFISICMLFMLLILDFLRKGQLFVVNLGCKDE